MTRARGARPDIPTLGVEEELLLVDPATSQPAPRASDVLARAPDAEHELRREQVEVGTEPLQNLTDLRQALLANRRDVSDAARSRGLAVVATGAAWMSPEQPRLTDDDRYRRMAETFGPIALRQLVDGCHVHVGMADRAAAIEVVNRVRPWLSTLLALSANSPFWDGEDTGYASYRHEVWSRWPTAGTAGPFAGITDYQSTIEQLIRSGAAVDAGMIYFHVRPSAQWPTVEFRIADVCLTVDEAVAVAALSRALAVTALNEAEQRRAGARRRFFGAAGSPVASSAVRPRWGPGVRPAAGSASTRRSRRRGASRTRRACARGRPATPTRSIASWSPSWPAATVPTVSAARTGTGSASRTWSRC